MTTNIWRIVWRNTETGDISYTGLSNYTSWSEADAALTTLLGFVRNGLTPTIEREVVEVR
jgi:hypothetical protein